MKVLVTGGAGFIGANLCRTLRARFPEAEIVALDDLSTGFATNLEGVDAELLVGSILDPDALAEAISSATAVVHLAARPSVPRSIADPVASHEANATGTLRVLDAARHIPDTHVIVASSSSVYGANAELPKRETMVPMPMSPYAVSKLATEQYALAWQKTYGVRTLAFRFFNVFGPLQAAGHAYAAVIPAFIEAALTGRPLPLNGDGSQSRDFTYVGTVCDVIASAIERSVSSFVPVNLAFGTRTTLLDLIDRLQTHVGNELQIERRDPRVGDVPHSQADHSLLKTLFPGVRPVELDSGLGITLDWMRTQVSQSM